MRCDLDFLTLLQVWQLEHDGSDFKVLFRGSLTNHSKAVNCVRFRGQRSAINAKAFDDAVCAQPDRRALPFCFGPFACTPGSRQCRNEAAHTGDSLVSAGDGGEMMIWMPALEGDKEISSWKVSQLLRCAPNRAPLQHYFSCVALFLHQKLSCKNTTRAHIFLV